MVTRTDLAMEFLSSWNSIGPWILTAIGQDGISTRTFKVEELQQMETWITEFNGVRNLYFTINPTFTGEFSSKPKRSDISSIIAFHLDVDPRAGEDLSEERIRILKSLQEFVPHPSVIVNSGGGYQAFWLLEEPIKLDGTEETAIAAESYSVQLELLLSADKCSNCDRIFRLPGTVNIPNEVKLKKGRVRTLSNVEEATWKHYPIEVFTKAPLKIQSKIAQEQLPGGGERVRLSGNIAPLTVEDLTTRGINVDKHIKTLIIHGENPDNPQQYGSRSECLFAVVCALVKAGALDETIAGLIMNRDNGISASILDKNRAERYCARQIQNAREEVENPLLRKLNSRHAVISDMGGGKCRIISETYDHALKRARIAYQSFDDFRNRYCNQKVQIASDKDGNPVLRPAGQWWINHSLRRQYDTIIFAPGREIPEAYNLWQGFACEAIPGVCDLFLNHVRQNLCLDNEEHNNYLLGWLARCVQQPDCPGEVAIVLRGEMGTGKSFFAKTFGSLFGRHFIQVSDPKHLVGSFNSHLRDAVVLFGDEAFWAGDKKHESVLKSLITEENLSIESKGVDLFSAPNYTHTILASNSEWVVPAGTNERRFFVLNVGSNKMQDKKYFSAMQAEMNNGGREALLHFLLNYDISNFEVREVPKTSGLQDQKLLSLSPEEMWWFEKLEEGRILKEHDYWEREVMKIELQDDYVIFMQRTGIMRKCSPTVLGKFLGRVCPGGVPKSFQKVTKVTQQGKFGEEYSVTRRMYFYEIPEIEKLRTHWDKYYGGSFKWNTIIAKEEQMEFREDAPERVFR